VAARNIKGLVCELKAQARLAQNPDLIVFIPLGGLGPVDIVTLNKKTGEFQGYDVKSFAKRSKGVKYKNKHGNVLRRTPGGRINRALTKLQKKLKIKIIYEEYK
jgi:hypothetical protein|tara:strand:+ start:227 stop:538 length:312 start_codon:yes stop_codon:yes gene_type:complete